MAINSFPQVFELYKNLDHQFTELTIRTAHFHEDQNPLYKQIYDLTNNLKHRMIEFMASDEGEETAKIGMQLSEDINAIMPLYKEWILFLNKKAHLN